MVLGSGCSWTHVESKRFAGLTKSTAPKYCGEVAFITYSPRSAGGIAGAIQVVYAAPSDAVHTTQWKLKRLPYAMFGRPKPVGGGPITVPVGGKFADYDLTFIQTPPDDFQGNPALVRVYRDQMATVAIFYKPGSCDKPAEAKH